MGTITDKIYDYFSDGEVPLSRKVKLAILAILAIVLIDNHCGFSHTLINSYKVDYMTKLESARKQFKEDPQFVEKIDELIKTEQNRKGAVEKVFSLLQIRIGNKKKTGQGANVLYNKIINERNPGLHTLTGAFVPFLLMVHGAMILFLSLLRPKRRNIDSFFWAVIIIVIGAILTYYVSLSWAVLDPIDGKIWINYIIQFVTNIIVLVLIMVSIEASNHKSKKLKVQK